MAKINRDNIEDAKAIIEKFLPDNLNRKKFINFLGDAISFADVIKNDNWNLNLDKSGHFLRFNTGQEYCIQLTEFELLILCDRKTIKPVIQTENIPVYFRGFKNQRAIEDINIDKVPDLLAKTKVSCPKIG